jgi:hypothetical protein
VINQLMLYILAAGLTAIAYVNKAGIVTYNYSNTLHESDDDVGCVGRRNSFRVLRSHPHRHSTRRDDAGARRDGACGDGTDRYLSKWKIEKMLE